jgi:hypothetical protein
MFAGLWPWTLVHFAAVPWALLVIFRELKKHDALGAVDDQRDGALLAVFYLAWFVEANFAQRQFDYQLVQPIILGIVFLAGEPQLRRAVAMGCAAWIVATAWGSLAGIRFWQNQLSWQLVQLAIVPLVLAGETILRMSVVALALVWAILQYPVADPGFRNLWVQCWTAGASPEVRNQAEPAARNHISKHDATVPDWIALEQVAQYLRRQGVRDRDLICYSHAAVPLYLELGIQPASRFVLLRSMPLYFPHHHEQLAREIAASPARFVVNDLEIRGFVGEKAPLLQAGEPLPRPNELPGGLAHYFPWNEPIVFRAGRYLVHEVQHKESKGAPTPPPPLW